jgi:hypothetical protein
MRRLMLVALTVFSLGLGGCLIVDDGGGSHEYDFNGFWDLALTGCQAQIAPAEIIQVGTAFTMLSTYRFDGVCDPFAGDFVARTDQRWGYWQFAGTATGDNTMAGTYVYGEFGHGECAGTFTAQRTGYRTAGAAPGLAGGLQRLP